MNYSSNYNHFTGIKKKIRVRKKDKSKRKNVHKNKYQRFSNAEELLKKEFKVKRGEDMKITIECTENEITAIQNNLKSGKEHEPIFKYGSTEATQNSEEFNLDAHGTVREIIKKLGIKHKEKNNSSCEKTIQEISSIQKLESIEIRPAEKIYKINGIDFGKHCYSYDIDIYHEDNEITVMFSRNGAIKFSNKYDARTNKAKPPLKNDESNF